VRAHGGRHPAVGFQPGRERRMQLRRQASTRPYAGESKARRSPERAFADALKWRDEWRAEIEARPTGANEQKASPPSPTKRRSEADAKALFAAAIARAELKRFHWDARREKEFQLLKAARRKIAGP
jgi:hypothetical protein